MQEKQEAWILSVGREDPVEKEMATYSSILARKSHRQRRVGNDSMHTHTETLLFDSRVRSTSMVYPRNVTEIKDDAIKSKHNILS